MTYLKSWTHLCLQPWHILSTILIGMRNSCWNIGNHDTTVVILFTLAGRGLCHAGVSARLVWGRCQHSHYVKVGLHGRVGRGRPGKGGLLGERARLVRGATWTWLGRYISYSSCGCLQGGGIGLHRGSPCAWYRYHRSRQRCRWCKVFSI